MHMAGNLKDVQIQVAFPIVGSIACLIFIY